MKYKAVIFDLDGVICHTDEYHYQAWKKVAEKLAVPFDRKINDRLRGVSRTESFEIILEHYKGVLQQENKEYYINKKNEIYKDLLKNMGPEDLAEEVKDTLNTLKRYGLKLAVGSSSKNAGFILQRLGLGGYFDAVSDGNNIQRSKPDPEVFLKACGMVEISPEDCLVVEDADAGVEAARACGMDCAGIGGAARVSGVTYKLEYIDDLLAIPAFAMV